MSKSNIAKSMVLVLVDGVTNTVNVEGVFTKFVRDVPQECKSVPVAEALLTRFRVVGLGRNSSKVNAFREATEKEIAKHCPHLLTASAPVAEVKEEQADQAKDDAEAMLAKVKEQQAAKGNASDNGPSDANVVEDKPKQTRKPRKTQAAKDK